MLPTVIALVRHHRQAVAIFVLNSFLGWTFLGWIGSPVWCLTNPTSAQVTVVNQWTGGGQWSGGAPATGYGFTAAQGPPAGGPPPGWYPDPAGGAARRYWSGNAWTEHRQ